MSADRESCGRCSMSITVDVATATQDEQTHTDRDPYGEARIEVDERKMRISPGYWLSRLQTRLDNVMTRVIWDQER